MIGGFAPCEITYVLPPPLSTRNLGQANGSCHLECLGQLYKVTFQAPSKKMPAICLLSTAN